MIKIIKDNYLKILENVNNATAKCGKSLSDIELVGVTKTVEPSRILEAIDLGINIVGENRVQEFLSKYDELKARNVDFHIIGQLQTNKVKYIADKVSMIQSVDSIKLAKEIDKQCCKLNKVMDCLVEINVGSEDSKGGLLACEFDSFFDEVAKFKNIRIKGIMSIPPKSNSEKEIRNNFSKLYELFIDIRNKKMDNINMDILSMGMSNDYEYAILEGATMIRIGTALFGNR